MSHACWGLAGGAIFCLNANPNDGSEASVGALLIRVCGIEVAEKVLQAEFGGLGFDRVGGRKLSVDVVQRSLENFPAGFWKKHFVLSPQGFPGDFMVVGFKGAWRETLGALGGIGASYSMGKAKVASGLRDENGGYGKVVSGRITSQGYPGDTQCTSAGFRF